MNLKGILKYFFFEYPHEKNINYIKIIQKKFLTIKKECIKRKKCFQKVKNYLGLFFR
jgi:hypothetical protein